MVTGSTTAAFDHGSWVQFADLGLAFVLAAIIGLERELRAKSAGLRTHTLVGVGAAIFVLISKYGFADVLGGDNVSLDPSRIAANIVTGIGFIGGGLIFIRGDAVRGLTTAATIWMAAAIGASAGAGLWLLAIAATVLHLLVVYGVRWIETLLPNSATATSQLEITYEVGHGSFGIAVERLTSAGFTIARVRVKEVEEGSRRARIDLGGHGSIADAAGSIEGLVGITAVRATDANAALE